MSTPRIRQATFEDYPDLADLGRRYGLEHKSLDEWVHLWVDNPAYIANRQTWPIGWVLEERDGRLVGYIGNIPMWYELRGARLLAAIGHGWVVEEHFRNYAIYLITNYFNQRGIDLLLTNTAGPATAKTFTVFGSLRPRTGVWDEAAFWVTNCRGFASAVSKRLATRLCTPLPRVVEYPLSLAVLCAAGLRNHRLRSIPLEDVEWCTSFDSRFDEFWDALRARNNGLLGVRSRDVLEWRFGRGLRSGNVWVLATSHNSRLDACSILFRNRSADGLERMQLADFQCLDGNTSRLQQMLACAYRRCRRENVHVIESMGFCDRKRASLAACAPFRRKLECWRFFYKVSNPRLSTALEGRDVWDPCSFDGDACL